MNHDNGEVQKFDALAASWWDRNGPSKPLHEINPLRLKFISERATLAGARALDVGCGGGILTEALAASGAQATGVDLAEQAIEVAREHAKQSRLNIDYQVQELATFADEHEGRFDVITCLEMLEHVPHPEQIVANCSRLVKPGGQVFFSTINRNAKAWLTAIVGAEHILNMIPKGTHHYAKLIKPEELAASCRQSGLLPMEFAGISYRPLSRRFHLTNRVDVNYLLHCQKQ